jgi:hypothetical protein
VVEEVQEETIVEATTTPPVVPEPVSSVLTNCWAFAKQVYPSLPSTKEMWVNATQTPGGVALFKYKSGLVHYAVVESVGTSTIDIVETNYKHGKKTERTVSLSDGALRGFYLPQQ